MKNNLIDLLSTFTYPVKLQGSLNEAEAYPDSFFTFWNIETVDDRHYDNTPIRCVWRFTVYFYSNNPTLVNTVLLDAVKLLRQNGWIIDGKGYDVPTDEITHTGRAVDVLYIEMENEDEHNITGDC